jgi:hypothetical protein
VRAAQLDVGEGPPARVDERLAAAPARLTPQLLNARDGPKRPWASRTPTWITGSFTVSPVSGEPKLRRTVGPPELVIVCSPAILNP